MKYKLETGPGDYINSIAKRAKEMSENESCDVDFEFNEIVCIVNKKTNLDWLIRDYHNAWIMGWKIVGPYCKEKYSPEIQSELERRGKELEEKNRVHEIERANKELKERTEFEKRVYGISLELSDTEGWLKARRVNSDGYGGAALDFAEGFAKLMQIDISKGKTVAQAYNDNQYQLGFLGITGFQFGAAISTLVHTWKYGEELRKAHNKEFGLGDNAKGTANPALFSVG